MKGNNIKQNEEYETKIGMNKTKIKWKKNTRIGHQSWRKMVLSQQISNMPWTFIQIQFSQQNLIESEGQTFAHLFVIRFSM